MEIIEDILSTEAIAKLCTSACKVIMAKADSAAHDGLFTVVSVPTSLGSELQDAYWHISSDQEVASWDAASSHSNSVVPEIDLSLLFSDTAASIQECAHNASSAPGALSVGALSGGVLSVGALSVGALSAGELSAGALLAGSCVGVPETDLAHVP